MANSPEVKSLVNKLVITYLAKGVQPEELASALYEDEYEEFSITKIREKNSLTVKLSFYDFEDDSHTLHKFKYTYELSTGTLFKVEQAIGNGKFKVQWDRVKTISELYKSIKGLISIEDFKEIYIDKLPKELGSKLSLVA